MKSIILLILLSFTTYCSAYLSCFQANNTYLVLTASISGGQVYTCSAPINWYNTYNAKYSITAYSANNDAFSIYFGYCGSSCNIQTSSVRTWSTSAKAGYAEGKAIAAIPGTIWQPFILIMCDNIIVNCKIMIYHATIDITNNSTNVITNM